MFTSFVKEGKLKILTVFGQRGSMLGRRQAVKLALNE